MFFSVYGYGVYTGCQTRFLFLSKTTWNTFVSCLLILNNLNILLAILNEKFVFVQYLRLKFRQDLDGLCLVF